MTTEFFHLCVNSLPALSLLQFYSQKISKAGNKANRLLFHCYYTKCNDLSSPPSPCFVDVMPHMLQGSGLDYRTREGALISSLLGYDVHCNNARSGQSLRDSNNHMTFVCQTRPERTSRKPTYVRFAAEVDLGMCVRGEAAKHQLLCCDEVIYENNPYKSDCTQNSLCQDVVMWLLQTLFSCQLLLGWFLKPGKTSFSVLCFVSCAHSIQSLPKWQKRADGRVRHIHSFLYSPRHERATLRRVIYRTFALKDRRRKIENPLFNAKFEQKSKTKTMAKNMLI